ncbi:DNA polymerase III subunit epsilon [Pikeienuella piscinae]|uniref:DNA polymerase III subunit epsilon n=1 Tax=Pikeienuella piscinae TaxID=2748098 RepID=A0A7L5BZN1_9RHOB|nr:DNA polymerase III subunit epsilon [Pikeienuella piscinae]QIE56298.1 DNA polymerase III subunit epsilon [Pikeienuella piscinae]
MREIVLDTETTGLDPFDGHRIVEIGGVELLNHMPTGRFYHQYINPMRDMPAEAFAVHGLSSERLSKEPVFAAIAEEFVAFIGDATLVIHNAPFDMKFINAELRALGLDPLPAERARDTLAMARKRFPGSPAGLDALCRRFGIDNSAREKHGALLDSELLAEVYLELIGGRQPDLGVSLSPGGATTQTVVSTASAWRPGLRPAPLPPRLTEEDAARHAAFVESLGPDALWWRTPGG